MSLYEQLKTLSNRVSSLEGFINNPEYDQLTASFFNATELTASSLYTPNATITELTVGANGATFNGAVGFQQDVDFNAPVGFNDSVSLAQGVYVGDGSALLDTYEEGTWTPTPANFTVVGTPDYSGRYTIIGNMVFITVSISSTTTTAATAGTSYLSLPVAVLATQNSTVTAASASSGAPPAAGYGVGWIDATNDRIYVPTWAATKTVILSGFYEKA